MLDALECPPLAWLFWAGAGGVVLPPLAGWLWPAIAGRLLRRRTPGAATAPATDQLEAVEGIGPEVGALLRAAGIDSFAALADTDQTALRAILRDAGPRMAMLEPVSWPAQARLLAHGDIENFLKLAVALKGGVPRLEDIAGIGPAIAESLRQGAVNSIAALADSSAEQVRRLTGDMYDSAVIEAWLEQARMLNNGDEAAILALARLKPHDIRAATGRAGDGAFAAKALPVAASLLGDGLLSSSVPLRPVALLGAMIMLATLLFGKLAAGDYLPGFITPACFGAGPAPCAACEGPCPVLPPGGAPIGLVQQSFGADVLFASGDDRLTDAGEQAVSAMAAAFAERLSDPAALAITARVTGHADAMRYRGEGGNASLSLRRARAVGAVIVRRPELAAAELVTIGKGSLQPSGHTNGCPGIADLQRRALCLSPDRRVEVTLVARQAGQ